MQNLCTAIHSGISASIDANNKKTLFTIEKKKEKLLKITYSLHRKPARRKYPENIYKDFFFIHSSMDLREKKHFLFTKQNYATRMLLRSIAFTSIDWHLELSNETTEIFDYINTCKFEF